MTPKIFSQAMVHSLLEVRLPFPEIVIHIYSRNAGRFRPPLQPGKRPGYRQCALKQFIAARKFKIVNNIDEQQNCAVIIWRAAMQVVPLA